MAETGAHSALSGAIAIAIFRILVSVSFLGQAIIVAIASFAGHLFLDIFPHGHTKKMWKELLSSTIIIPVIFYVSFSKGGWKLVFLSGVAVFFGSLFDFALEIARKLEKMPDWIQALGKKIIKFNLWIHWFVRSSTFCLSARQDESKETWKGRPVYSWKYGWYNLIPLVLSTIVFFLVL